MFNLTAPVMYLTLTLPTVLAKNLTASPLFTDFFKFNRLVDVWNASWRIAIIIILVILIFGVTN